MDIASVECSGCHKVRRGEILSSSVPVSSGVPTMKRAKKMCAHSTAHQPHRKEQCCREATHNIGQTQASVGTNNIQLGKSLIFIRPKMALNWNARNHRFPACPQLPAPRVLSRARLRSSLAHTRARLLSPALSLRSLVPRDDGLHTCTTSPLAPTIQGGQTHPSPGSLPTCRTVRVVRVWRTPRLGGAARCTASPRSCRMAASLGEGGGGSSPLIF